MSKKITMHSVRTVQFEGKALEIGNRPGEGQGRPFKMVRRHNGKWIPAAQFIKAHPDSASLIRDTYKPRKAKATATVKASAKKVTKKATKTAKAKTVKAKAKTPATVNTPATPPAPATAPAAESTPAPASAPAAADATATA